MPKFMHSLKMILSQFFPRPVHFPKEKNARIVHFSRSGQSEPTCAVDEIEREDCGYYGIKSDRCQEAGCCWKPNPEEHNVENIPWCFFPGKGC